VKITRVLATPVQPPASYAAPASWLSESLVANPMSIYPRYRDRRSSWGARWGHEVLVRIETDEGLIGIGGTAPAPARMIIEDHLAHLLLGEDPAAVERLWDQMYRASVPYGRKGLPIMAISAIDIALWDLLGKWHGVPVYQLLGGKVQAKLPLYATGNEVAWYMQFGFTRFKLAMPHGPADGPAGLRANLALVEQARETAGPDADLMLDCYMAWDLEYTLRMAEALRPYRVRWIEECLPPDDYAGYTELTRRVEGMAVATGEHEYTRWGFGELLSRQCCHIIQPDLSWCGGISEARHIASLASAHHVQVIPHAGGLQPWGIHWLAAQAARPLAEYVVIASREDGALRPMVPFLRGMPQPDGGFLVPSDAPGLGVEVEEDWLDKPGVR
jgi:L-rhamnonate dehydratase